MLIFLVTLPHPNSVGGVLKLRQAGGVGRRAGARAADRQAAGRGMGGQAAAGRGTDFRKKEERETNRAARRGMGGRAADVPIETKG